MLSIRISRRITEEKSASIPSYHLSLYSLSKSGRNFPPCSFDMSSRFLGKKRKCVQKRILRDMFNFKASDNRLTTNWWVFSATTTFKQILDELISSRHFSGLPGKLRSCRSPQHYYVTPNHCLHWNNWKSGLYYYENISLTIHLLDSIVLIVKIIQIGPLKRWG